MINFMKKILKKKIVKKVEISEKVCGECKGTGRHLPEQTCPSCKGTGK